MFEKHIKKANKSILDLQEHVYAQMHPNYRPGALKRVDEDTLEYNFIQGEECFDIAQILEAAYSGIWNHNSRRTKICNTSEYINYMHGLLAYHYSELETLGCNPGAAFEIFERLSNCTLTPVFTTHGDMTLQNTIREAGSKYIRFIDPADDHLLRCRELDESKLLQSIDGWEIIARGWFRTIKNVKLINRSEANLILLLSHYIRMLRYQKGNCKMFAYKRIFELIDQLK